MTLVVDSSAVMALLMDESEAPAIEMALADSHPVVIGAPTLVELTIVAEARLGPQGVSGVDRILRYADIEVVDFSVEAAREAIDGWRRFGKGRHPAALNLGDCSTYGLARSCDGVVLCTGDDFVQTDVEVLAL